MRYYVLFGLVTLAGFSAGAAAASLGVAVIWRWGRSAIQGLSAARRARWLLGLRLLPTLCATVVSLAIATAFLRFEPRDTREEAGALLAAFALLTVACVAATAVRTLRLFASDSALSNLVRHCREWTSTDGAAASILDTAYPVAAVAGVLKPRLMLSERVLRECTPAEISVIVAHERAHVRRRDNLVRAMFATLPDAWLTPRTTAAIESAWTRAAEEAADAEAAGGADVPRAALAATLIHVARMADQAPPAWMPQLAFYQGTDLEHRVRTLLAEPRLDSPAASAVEAAVLATATAAMAIAFASSQALHVLMEWGVTLLP